MTIGNGMRGADGQPAIMPMSNGPFITDQHYTFAGGVSFGSGEGDVWYVDGTNGNSVNQGKSWSDAFVTIQAAVTKASAGDIIYVTAKDLTDFTGDPTSYAETIIIPASTSNLSIIGISRGRTQGGLPQIKIGSGSTAMITVRAPGCLISSIGINGASSTGGGILLDDDNSAKSAFGTSIVGCHFKNCVGSSATNAATGGAIMWSVEGNAWQVNISGNRFYKNVGDVVLLGTNNTVPQDVVIENNIFSGPSGNVDCNLYLQGGSGINGLIIRNNVFTANPNIGSGTNVNFLRLTGCVGIMSGNMFAATVAEGETEITFGASGDNTVPTTMFMAANYGEFVTGVGAGKISGEIFRT